MVFEQKNEFAEEVGDTYGQYMCSFTSDTGQVHAEVFRQGDKLVAYISYREDVNPNNVSDKYYSHLFDKARELGYPDRLELIHTGV